jgi:hypothetical protein
MRITAFTMTTNNMHQLRKQVIQDNHAVIHDKCLSFIVPYDWYTR